jgi:hypothetical protein
MSLVLASAAIVALATITSAAQKSQSCPAIIASLLPKNGSIRGGDYNASGPMGLGSGSADLPFDHPCIKSDKYPARVSVAVTYYNGNTIYIDKKWVFPTSFHALFVDFSPMAYSQNHYIFVH